MQPENTKNVDEKSNLERFTKFEGKRRQNLGAYFHRGCTIGQKERRAKKNQGRVITPSLEGIARTAAPHGRERRGAGSAGEKKEIK